MRRLAAGFLVATVAAGCGSWGFGEGGDGLTPEGTIETYLDASVSGDCRAASRNATPDLVRQGLWCDDPRVLSFGEISALRDLDRPGERYFVVEDVVVGGTNLDFLGLQAGANEILVQVVQQPDGKWRVHSTAARRPPIEPPPAP